MAHQDDDTQIMEALVNQGVEYAVAEDKAFLAKDVKAEGVAHGGREATEKALAVFMGVPQHGREATEKALAVFMGVPQHVAADLINARI